MSIDEATAADRTGEFEVAAHEYEACLARGELGLDGLLNLAILYWQATDFGTVAAKNLAPPFVAEAGRRFPAILADARQAFPESTEAEFWARYVRWADLGEALSVDTCRALLQRDGTALVPAMFVFSQSHGQEREKDAVELLRRCELNPTTKNRYVASVVRGVLHRGSANGS